jgi:hypothetical protein
MGTSHRYQDPKLESECAYMLSVQSPPQMYANDVTCVIIRHQMIAFVLLIYL